MRDFATGEGFNAVLPGEKKVDTPKEILVKIKECKKFMGDKIKKLSQCQKSLDNVSSGEELNETIDRWLATLEN